MSVVLFFASDFDARDGLFLVVGLAVESHNLCKQRNIDRMLTAHQIKL